MKEGFQLRSLLLVALSSSPIFACFGGSTGGGCCSPGYAGGCGPTVPSCYSRQPEYRAFPAGYETAAVSAPIIAGPFPAQSAYAVGDAGSIGGPFPASAAPIPVTDSLGAESVQPVYEAGQAAAEQSEIQQGLSQVEGQFQTSEAEPTVNVQIAPDVQV